MYNSVEILINKIQINFFVMFNKKNIWVIEITIVSYCIYYYQFSYHSKINIVIALDNKLSLTTY